jgi:hypothetical protein
MRPTLTNEFDCQWRIRMAIDATMEISFYRNYEPKDAIEALLESSWSHYVSYKTSVDELLETRHIDDSEERRKLIGEACEDIHRPEAAVVFGFLNERGVGIDCCLQLQEGVLRMDVWLTPDYVLMQGELLDVPWYVLEIYPLFY